MAISVFNNPDALPQLIGEFRPADEWQAHINDIFYGLRGGRLREFYQTFAAADYRLGHALAADYFEKVRKRDKVRGSKFEAGTSNAEHRTEPSSTLTIMEWGCGNGNLAACFLSHLKRLDKDGLVYPRVRYVLVDAHEATLRSASAHPDLAEHKDRIETRCSRVEEMSEIKDGTVDRILCNELWNDMPTKLMLRKAADIEEEFLRPNLTETKQAEISDWSAFVQTFDKKDIGALSECPAFLEDIIWEKEYRKTEWKDVPYRKTISEFLKKIDEEVLVPVNLGACATVKEAKRLLAPDAIGFSSFDAGTADLKVLNDPEKPCYGQFGGQYSFMVNFALVEAAGRHHAIATETIELQREFVGRSLNTNVLSLMDLLATHPTSPSLKPWQQDRLLLRTVHALNETYESPYRRKIDFAISNETPPEELESLQRLLHSLKENGVPDTIAYLTEDEIFGAMRDLEAIGYEREIIQAALVAPPQGVDYYHHFFRP
ncbi:MAG: class I SAM-dependent methyltransferase [Nitrospiraceae bacterium]